jgi:hypothetical protein
MKKMNEKDEKSVKIIQKSLDSYPKPDYINGMDVKFIPGGVTPYFVIEFKVNDKYTSKRSNRWMNNVVSYIRMFTPYSIAGIKIIFEK